jgi:transcriptional regulator with XRE-family HTH domain
MTDDPLITRDDEDWWRALGERLRESREYLGLSQQDVAVLLGLSRPAITHMEAGKRKVSTLELRELSRVYRRSFTWLIGDESGESPSEDELTAALFRTTRSMSDRDREQLLKFAQFLADAGPPPDPAR